MIKKVVLLWSLLLSIPCFATPIAAFTFSDSEVVGDSNVNWTLGVYFNVLEDINVTHLGAFDFNSDGFVVDHEVGIWNQADELLASAIVTSNDSLTGLFRYAQIASLFLSPGQYYIGASGYGLGGDAYARDAVDLTSPESIEFDGSVFSITTNNEFVAPLIGSGRVGLFGANILIESVNVPAPNTLLLMLLGLACFARMKKFK